MKKTTITVCTLILLSGVGYSQSKETINDLHHQLAVAKNKIDRIEALLALSYEYRLGNADSGIFYGKQALEASKKAKYIPGEVRALGFIAIASHQIGNIPQALEMGFTSLQVAEANNLPDITGAPLNALGETYILLKDYPKALYYLRLQKANAEKRNSIEGLAYSQYDMGAAFYEMNQLDSALYYEQQAIKYFRNMGREEPLVYRILGDIAMKQGNKEEALLNYQKSLRIAANNSERRALASAYNKIAGFYKTVNQPDSAIHYAKAGFQVSDSITQKNTLMDAAALLSQLYEPTDTKESLRYLKIANTYKDSLFGTGSLQSVQTLVTHEEKRQQEIEEAKVAYQNRLKQFALIAGLAAALLIAFFLFRNARKEKKAKQQLQEKNAVIEETLKNLKATQSQLIHSEKMASLGELTAGIAHEIQNPLNFVNNFSEVNKELLAEMNEEIDKGNYDDAKAMVKDIRDNEEKINHHGRRADAIVKGMLQHSHNTKGEKEPTDINALTDEYLRLAYHGLRAKDKTFNATMKTDFDETLKKVNIIPQDMGRVMLNLINNAFYAVDEKKKSGLQNFEPTVSVSTKKEGDKVLISVNDNGNGIPQKVLDKIFQPFFTTKPTGQGTGLGLSLSYDIVKAHGGELTVETKEHEGTTFIFYLTLN